MKLLKICGEIKIVFFFNLCQNKQPFLITVKIVLITCIDCGVGLVVDNLWSLWSLEELGLRFDCNKGKLIK